MLGRGQGPVDVWERATAPGDEAPECAWCPVCRAARVLRESGPGVTSQVAAVGDVVSTLVQDTVSVFEAALAATGKTPRPDAESGGETSGTPWTGVMVQDPEEEPESMGPPGGPPHEPDDRG
jgi:hypothetical protein